MKTVGPETSAEFALRLDFGLRLAPEMVDELRSICAASGPYETGGILVGRYSEAHDTAIVETVGRAPSDSTSAGTAFHRGVEGLQDMLARRFDEDGAYYLGEWHSHPHAAAIASREDREQMVGIAHDLGYACPQPILLIVGGDPGGLLDLRAYIAIRGAGFSELPRPTSFRRNLDPSASVPARPGAATSCH